MFTALVLSYCRQHTYHIRGPAKGCALIVLDTYGTPETPLHSVAVLHRVPSNQLPIDTIAHATVPAAVLCLGKTKSNQNIIIRAPPNPQSPGVGRARVGIVFAFLRIDHPIVKGREWCKEVMYGAI